MEQARLELHSAKDEAKEILLEAKSRSDEMLDSSQKECESRREVLEREMERSRELEISRIEEQWQIQTKILENKRRHEFSLLVENLEIGIRSALKGIILDSTSEDDLKRFFEEVSMIVQHSISSGQTEPNGETPTNGSESEKESLSKRLFSFRRSEPSDKADKKKLSVVPA
ncbi:MAG: hypothetical protein IPK68_00975 [Bdellovibrionales bacterium]|nr:hypothetical protein [Bdellovibrionales bacterium]